MERGNSVKSLAVATRMQRLAESMLDQMDDVYREIGLNFQSRWMPIYQILLDERALTISDLAAHLEMTHAELLHFTRPMSEAGLLEIHKDRLEGNLRMFKLTPRALEIKVHLEQVQVRFEEAEIGLFRAAQCEIGQILDRIERAVAGGDLTSRILGSFEPEAQTGTA